MLKLVNHIEANRGGKHLKFPIASHPKGPYKHHIVVIADTSADVNCMNEKTFNELFPEVQLSVSPHDIQNFRNSVADISILGQFCTYLEFGGESTFRMGVLLPNYPLEIVVKGENVPHFSKNELRQNREWHTEWYIQWFILCQHREWYTKQYVKCVPDTKQHTEKVKSSTVPVQFRYDSHSARDGNSFQDHHTLCTSINDSDSKAGRFSTCTCTPSAKYFMEWTSSTWCTCPQATATGSETWRLVSLEKSPAPTQWKDLCE